MRRVLILTGFDPLTHTGGIETFTLQFIGLLQGLQVHTDLVCAGDFQNVYRLHNPFLGQVYSAGRSLLNLEPERYDCILANGYYGGGYFPKRIPVITVFHSTHAGYAEAIQEHVPESEYLEIRNIIGDIFERSAAWNARIVAVSERVRSELEEHYGLGDIHVIPNGVDTEFFSRLPHRESLRRKYGISPEAKVGLFVGRWETSKGTDVLLKTMETTEEIFWVVVSPSGGETYMRGDRNVLSLTAQKGEQMREIYSLSDFMLFPSRYEGFGLAAAEAMAAGLPVIGTPVGFLHHAYGREPFSSLSLPPDLRGTRQAGVLVRDMIFRLLADGSLWSEVSERGREEIEKRYNKTLWEKSMKEILCLN